MNIAVFSDIHGNYQALKSIIYDIRKNNIKEIVYLGDSIGLGPSSNYCLDLLIKENVKFVAGNHDLYYARGCDIDANMSVIQIEHNKWIDSTLTNVQKEYLKARPLKLGLKALGKKIVFEHFFQDEGLYPFHHLSMFKDGSYKEIMCREDADYVFFGHEHRQSFYEANGKKFYGVGSSGCTKEDDTYYHVINITKAGGIKYIKKYVKYNRRKFEKVIENTEFPNKEMICEKFFGIKM